MNKKQEVSKGLRSLLSNIEKTNSPKERISLVKELTNSIATINVESIEVNPYQVRTDFDDNQLLELAKSIKTSGLIQPVTVRSIGGEKFQLISGERRLRASKMAGVTEIPAYIRVANDHEMLEMALVENIQRADLNAIEIGISYQRLMTECNLTHEELSQRVGKDRSTVTNYVRLLKLPNQIQVAIKEGQLSMGHARALAGIDNLAMQLMLYNDTIENGLSVRALEAKIKPINATPAPSKSIKSENSHTIEVKKINDKLNHILGTHVTIRRDHTGKGAITIPFETDFDFNQIVDMLLKD